MQQSKSKFEIMLIVFIEGIHVEPGSPWSSNEPTLLQKAQKRPQL